MRSCGVQVFVAVLKMENRRVTIAGERVKLQGEVLHGIRVVKFYGAWRTQVVSVPLGLASRRVTRCALARHVARSQRGRRRS